MCPLHLVTHPGGPQTPGPILTETVKQHIPFPNALLDLDKLQCHPRPNLEGHGGKVSPSLGSRGCQRKPLLLLGLTSVSRMALCWARMLPRPAIAWGSSVMLCSPSGSASLSDSPAPLCREDTQLSRGSQAPGTVLGPLGLWEPPTPPPPHVASSSLMSCRRLMLGNFSWRSFFIPRLAPTGTTLMLL